MPQPPAVDLTIPAALRRKPGDIASGPAAPGPALIQTIPIADLEIGGRRRRLRSEQVDALAESIAALGLRTPITVVKGERLDRDTSKFRAVYPLIAGLHRLEACRRLGHETIDAEIVDLSDVDQQLWEIDENLCRADLTVLEKAEHLAARKDLYEIKYPKAKRGGDCGNQHTGGRQKANLGFCQDAATKTGESETNIKRSMRRAKRIAPEVRDAIRDTKIAESGVELDALAELDLADQQAVVAMISEGRHETVRRAAITVVSEKLWPPPPKKAPLPQDAASQEARREARRKKKLQQRLDRFNGFIGILTGVSFDDIDQMELPPLDAEQRDQALADLRGAERGIRHLKLKIEALDVEAETDR